MFAPLERLRHRPVQREAKKEGNEARKGRQQRREEKGVEGKKAGLGRICKDVQL